MDPSVVRITLMWMVPGILSVFGVAFVCAWFIDKKRDYLLLLAGGCGLFACGAMSQIFGLPPGQGPNAVVSGALYTAAVLAVAEGVLLRSHQRLGWRLDGEIGRAHV